MVADAATHRWVNATRTAVLCRVAETTTTGSVRASNLRLVADLVRNSGVDHFFVPVTGVDAYRIGVPVEQRQKLFDALLRLDPSPETYVRCSEIPWRDIRPFGAGSVPATRRP